jgi:hypothetical protein
VGVSPQITGQAPTSVRNCRQLEFTSAGTISSDTFRLTCGIVPVLGWVRWPDRGWFVAESFKVADGYGLDEVRVEPSL